MKTFFEFMKEDLDADLASFQKKRQSEPPRPDAFANADSATSNLNRNLIRKDPPITPKREPVDFTGSRYGNDGVIDQDKATIQNQKQLRKNYQQPPGYDTPAFDKTKQKMAAADARPGEPPMPGAGPYKTKQSNPLKTPRAVPVPIPKPKAKPPEIDQRVPRPKLRPERKPEITNTDNTKGPVAIPKPDSVGMNVNPSKKKTETFNQIFARTPEGKKFTWTNPQTGKTGTYIRKTKKG